MCDERERLIGYVYDECDDGERKSVEDHLASCETCRREIGGLRRVRQDLLAWDVPHHGSVWRPFAPPRPTFTWQDVPAWAMAVAAGIILLAGASGGVITGALLTRSQARAEAVAAAAPAPAAPGTVTTADLTALETRLLTTMRSEMDERVRVMSTHDTQPTQVQASADTEELKRIRNDQLALYSAVSTDLNHFGARVGRVENSLQQVAYLQAPAR